MRWADYVASTSLAMANQVLALTGSLRREVIVTPFGVDLERFRFFDRSERTRPSTVIGTVKGLKHIYGIDVLLRAFACLAGHSDKPLELHIYGGGPDEKELRQLSFDLGIDHLVRWGGTIRHEDVPNALKSMDIFACFSRQESFGVSALEAMATGLPVVATACVGFCELVAVGESGFIGPIEEPQTLASLLEKLVTDENLRYDMGRRGRIRAVADYDWQKNVTYMESIYHDIVRGETNK
jgi:glycosyltransferase involved in cell wall biosynthesis